MNALVKKSLTDVTRRKGRTLLVVAGIFLGVFGLTTINVTAATLFGAYAFSAGNQAAQPNIILEVNRLDPALNATLAAFPNVQAVQPETEYDSQWLSSAASGHIPIDIVSYPDLRHIPITPWQLTSGRYPGSGEIVMESGDRGLQPVALGDVVTIDTSPGTMSLTVVGLARTAGVNPVSTGNAHGYMSDAALAQAFGDTTATVPALGLGGSVPRPPSLHHAIAVRVHDVAAASTTAASLVATLQSHQIEVLGQMLAGQPADLSQLDGVFLLLRLLAILAVVMSGLLILTTVMTLVAEQTPIIGTMKALGGTQGAIIRSYLLTAGIYSVVGTLPGLALGLIGGYVLASSLASTIPLDVGPFMIDPTIIGTSLVVGLAVPLLAASLPAWQGTHITVRDALAAYGVSQYQRNGSIIRLLQRATWIPQTVWLGGRSLWRRRARTALTVLTLTLAGAIFLVVQIAATSIDQHIAGISANYTHDIEIDLHHSAILYTQTRDEVLAQVGVQHVEPYADTVVMTQWGQVQALGFAPDTHLYHYHLLRGRWLTDQDTNAVLLGEDTAAASGLHLGGTFSVWSTNGVATWTVIGIVHQSGDPNRATGTGRLIGAAVTSIATLNQFAHAPSDAAPALLVQTKEHNPGAVNQLANQLDTLLNSAAGPGARVTTAQQITQQARYSWYILYDLFYGVAVMVGIAGTLGLANALLTSVIERRREIGMLRALGGNTRQIAQVFWVEGLALSGIAWCAGLVVGLPLAYGFVQVLGRLVLPVAFVIDPRAFIIMLVALVSIATLASVMPAWRAAQLRIATLLRYE